MFLDEEGKVVSGKTYKNIRFDENKSECVLSLSLKDIPNFDRTKTWIQVRAVMPHGEVSAVDFFCKPKDYDNPSLYYSKSTDYQNNFIK